MNTLGSTQLVEKAFLKLLVRKVHPEGSRGSNTGNQ